MKLFTLTAAATLLLSPCLTAGGVIVPDPLYELHLSGTILAGPSATPGSPWSLNLTFSAPPVPIDAVGFGALNVTDITAATFTYDGSPISILGSNPLTASSLNLQVPPDTLSISLAVQSATAPGIISINSISDGSGNMIGPDGLLNPTNLSLNASGALFLLDEGPTNLTVQNMTITPIPEPQSALLAILALSSLAFRRRRR